MFTTSCYIRKDTKEIISKLVELGYKYIDQRQGNSLVATREGIILREVLLEDDATGGIDCGKNEDLFLAIAALRDDSHNSMQWITNGTHWELCVRQLDRHCYLCRSDKGGYVGALMEGYHKATVEELIEHFKEKP